MRNSYAPHYALPQRLEKHFKVWRRSREQLQDRTYGGQG